MKVSLNQIEQTARKAARGAGYAWGLADDVGRALRWLHAYRLDGAHALAAHLDCIDGDDAGGNLAAPVALTGVWRAATGALDPLLTGASLADSVDALLGDAGAGDGVETAAIAHPLLAAAFIICAAESDDRAFEVTWQDCELHCARGRVRLSGAVEATVAPFMRCRLCDASFRGRAPRIGESTVDVDAWKTLQRHAGRTHVAATAASRLTGAGAGLRDND